MKNKFRKMSVDRKFSFGLFIGVFVLALSLNVSNTDTANASTKEIRELKRQVAVLQSELATLKRNSKKGLPIGYSAQQIRFPQILGWNGRNDCPFGGLFDFMNSETMVFPYKVLGSSSKSYDQELSLKSCSIVVLVKEQD